MRIIAGIFRGRQLNTPRDRSVRPTTDRVKQSIFDILTTRLDFEGIDVLDLFSGSGSLGLEAISRGAATATFVDSSAKSLALLEKNIRLLGCGDQTNVHQADVFWFLKNTNRSYGLIFVDPPFALDTLADLPERISQSGVIREGTYVVLEHPRKSVVPASETSFEILRKDFGQTTVLIARSRRPAAPSDQ